MCCRIAKASKGLKEASKGLKRQAALAFSYAWCRFSRTKRFWLRCRKNKDWSHFRSRSDAQSNLPGLSRTSRSWLHCRHNWAGVEIIPPDGFYERRKLPGGKAPMRIRLRDDGLFGFAELWEDWITPDGEVIRTCTIITVPANDALRSIHDRMPAILRPETESVWLDPGAQGTKGHLRRCSRLRPRNRYLRGIRTPSLPLSGKSRLGRPSATRAICDTATINKCAHSRIRNSHAPGFTCRN